MDSAKKPTIADLLKRGYSSDEIDAIYALARLMVENGEITIADKLFSGLVEVAPESLPAWLGLGYVHAMRREWDETIAAARQALRIDPRSVEGLLLLSAALLSAGDLTTAGSYLGEVGEILESNSTENNDLLRFYRAQLARYSSRSS